MNGYEELRQQAVTGSRGEGKALGMTLFLRQGMRSWIEAWLCFQSNSPVTQHNEPDPYPALAMDLRAEIAMILTSMVLHPHTLR